MPGDLGFNEFPAFDDPMFQSEMKPSKGKTMNMGKTAVKTKAELPKNNFLAKYEMYSNKKELYVLTTINKDIEAM